MKMVPGSTILVKKIIEVDCYKITAPAPDPDGEGPRDIHVCYAATKEASAAIIGLCPTTWHYTATKFEQRYTILENTNEWADFVHTYERKVAANKLTDAERRMFGIDKDGNKTV